MSQRHKKQTLSYHTPLYTLALISCNKTNNRVLNLQLDKPLNVYYMAMMGVTHYCTERNMTFI